MHSRVRFNERLCENSMICLTQLASLMGDAIGPSGPIAVVMPLVGNLGERRLATVMNCESAQESASNRKPILHDQYVQSFVSQMIDLFSE
jgi:hypothetical protein